jgi:DNA-binding CsgD family transcriptional regulator
MVRRAYATYDHRAMKSITPREADVLRLIARGHTYAGAAERLGMSPHTVASHIKKAYRKLGVHSAGAAVMRAVKLGVLD